MIKEITAVGKDILEAKENARAALGVGELEDVQFEVLDGGTKGIFGLFSRPAKVRAFIELPDHEEKKRFDRKQKGEQKRSEAQNQHKDNSQNNQNKKNNQKKPERKKAEAAPVAEDKPRSEVIPEAELKMERRFVEAGEDMSYDFVKTVLSDIGLASEAELYICEDGTRRITIVGEDASTLIGHHGDTLDALQYLANLASARKNAKGERDKSRVTIDIEGYRKKREDTLRALARRMAAKALRNKRSVMLEPMSAYERRIIHSEIQGIEGVSTNSVGSDNNRKIVIFLTDKKPEGIFDEEIKEEALPLGETVAEDAAATDAIEAAEESSEDADTVSV